MDADLDQQAAAATRRWIEAAVVGLNLCPFARAADAVPDTPGRHHSARDAQALRADLEEELRFLAQSATTNVETTLLIHPWALIDFLEFNDFLSVAEAAVAELGLIGELQIASFHPHYQFAGTQPDDLENSTNRSPFPTLHLLREASVEHALATFPDPESIYQNNIETMRRIGKEGWERLQSQFTPDFFR
jgi:hypothetical protein